MITRRAALLGAFALSAAEALAQPAPNPPPPAEKTTQHTIALPGRTLAFQAQVATMRLANPQGQPQAEVVTTAFLQSGADPAQRPVTFVLNGGPGASSAWLNLGAIGPWRVPFGVVPSRAAAPIDNAETWLDFTDLVFIDPPGTGFSRIVAQGDEVRRQIWSVNGDIELLAVVIRRWLEGNGRVLAPKFIAGESYGGFRGPKLARTLLDRQGVGVSGLVLMSPVLDFNGRDVPWDPFRFVVTLPSMAAVVRGARGRAELRDVEEYAQGEYLQDLLRGEGDRAAVDRLTARVSALTGLEPALVRRRAGRIDTATFLRDREPGRVESPYDASISVPDPFPAGAHDNSPDPLLDGMRGPLTSAMLHVYSARLGWQPEGAPNRQYEILDGSVATQWDYGRRQVRPEVYTELRQYLALDPSVRVAVAHGLTDLVTPYFASKLLLDQTPPFGPEERLRLLTYGGGHMFYSRDESRAGLHDDAASLVAAALAGR
ncbi:MAG TPA: peptidase S10 [Acetobacteraceae bacterium]|nr:peptidase S10 [Acetobacteraceae bacterium]